MPEYAYVFPTVSGKVYIINTFLIMMHISYTLRILLTLYNNAVQCGMLRVWICSIPTQTPKSNQRYFIVCDSNNEISFLNLKFIYYLFIKKITQIQFFEINK